MHSAIQGEITCIENNKSFLIIKNHVTYPKNDDSPIGKL